MKNIKQIQLIIKKLDHEKTQFLRDLAKLNLYIEKKTSSLNKILMYQAEYAKEGVLEFSRTVPTLNQNLDRFATKIQDMIFHEENEIKKFTQSKTTIIEKIELLSNKIKVMNEFELQAKKIIDKKSDDSQQLHMDDLVANRHSRGIENE